MSAAKDISRKVMGKLGDWNINPTPAAYAVLFSHFEGENSSLSEAIENCLSEGTQPTEMLFNRLYSKFFADYSNDNEQIEKLALELVNQSSGLQGLAHALGSSANTFSAEVQAQADNAAKQPTADVDAEKIITGLLELTQKTVQQNKILEDKLDTAIANIGDLHDTLRQAEQHAHTDFLTKLPNRRKFDDFLTRQIEEAKESGDPLCLIVGDVDHFKSFNDKFGHKVGDQVLALVASIIRKNVKGKDLAARYGGEEFVIALPCTQLNQARAVADYIREEIANRPLALRKSNKEIGSVTISFGVAEWAPGETEEAFFIAADAALYEAKGTGRNKVSVAPNRLAESA